MNKCQGITKTGNPCLHRSIDGTDFCHQHQDQAQIPPEQRQITCIGFWLPCGRTNFFHPTKDQELLKYALPGKNLSDFRISALSGELSPQKSRRTFYDEESDALNNSVYRRLLSILRERGYLFAIPFFPEFRLNYMSIIGDTDPNTVVLISGEQPFTRRENPLKLASNMKGLFYGNNNGQTESTEQQASQQLIDEPTKEKFKGNVLNVYLVVSDEGFYQWLFHHEPIGEEYSEFVIFLKDHIRFLVGQLSIPKSDPTGRIVNSINWQQAQFGASEEFHTETQPNNTYGEGRQSETISSESSLAGTDSDNSFTTLEFEFSSRQSVNNTTRAMLNQYRSERQETTESQSIEQQVHQRFSKLYGQYPGILVFFQLNLVVEGVLNSLIDPRIFFAERFNPPETSPTGPINGKDNIGEWGEMVLYESEHYSLSGFAASILAYSLVGTNIESHTKLVILMQDCLNYLDCLKSDNRQQETLSNLRGSINSFVREVHQNGMRRDFLRQFMRKTAILLQKLKWNLEDCRRALLSHSISATDYHEFLVQIKSPDQRSLKFDKVNEAQISGYAKLSSAKLPIIKNIQRYIQLVFESSDEGELVRNQNLSGSKHNLKDIISYYQMWSNFCGAIEENIGSLERTLDRVNAERRLYEQSQTRYEQEAMAEIDRRRQRLGISASGEVSARLPSFLEVSLAFVGAISAIFTITYGISQPFVIRPWAYSVLIPFVFIYLFFVLARIVGGYIARSLILRRNRYYYELDIQLNLPIERKNAGKLFDQGFRGESNVYEPTKPNNYQVPREFIVAFGSEATDQKRVAGTSDSRAVDEEERTKFLERHQKDLPVFTEPEKTSYRFSQSALNQSDHKVHYEFDIHWEPSSERSWLDQLIRPFSRNSMENCELIYEVLSHSPSNDQQYMLRELRFIATYKDRLTLEQIALLKLKLANDFIYFWITSNRNALNNMDVVQNIAPIFSLTVEALLAQGQ